MVQGAGAPALPPSRPVGARRAPPPAGAAVFESPVKALGVSGGTAAFFALRYKEGCVPPGLLPDHWIGKDLERAADELDFYETAQSLSARGGSVREWRLLQWTFDYGGVIEALCDIEGSTELRKLLLLRNLFSGHEQLRLLDIKLGAVTAVGGWRGKGHIGAMVNRGVDRSTNSTVEGYRLEGFDGIPLGLDAWIDSNSQGGILPGSGMKKMRKMQRRRRLQCLTGEVILQWLVTLHADPAPVSAERLCSAEAGAWALRSMAAQLASLTLDAARIPVPQQWIGSSVGIGFDAAARPLRSSAPPDATVAVFDWGRSELLTPGKWALLPPDVRETRSDHWMEWVAAVTRLAFEAARCWKIRYCPKEGWQTCRFRVMTGEDRLVGQWSVRLETEGKMTLPLSPGEGSPPLSGAELDVEVLPPEQLPEGSLLAQRQVARVISAQGLREKDCYVTLTAHDAEGPGPVYQTSVSPGSGGSHSWEESFDFCTASEAAACIDWLPDAADSWEPPRYGAPTDDVRDAVGAFTDLFGCPMLRQSSTLSAKARSLREELDATVAAAPAPAPAAPAPQPPPQPAAALGCWDLDGGGGTLKVASHGESPARLTARLSGTHRVAAPLRQVPLGGAHFVALPPGATGNIAWLKLDPGGDTLQLLVEPADAAGGPAHLPQTARRRPNWAGDDANSESSACPSSVAVIESAAHTWQRPDPVSVPQRQGAAPAAAQPRRGSGTMPRTPPGAVASIRPFGAPPARSRADTRERAEAEAADSAEDRLRTEMLQGGGDPAESCRAAARAFPALLAPRRSTAAMLADSATAAADEIDRLRDAVAELTLQRDTAEANAAAAHAEASVLRSNQHAAQGPGLGAGTAGDDTAFSQECARFAQQLRGGGNRSPHHSSWGGTLNSPPYSGGGAGLWQSAPPAGHSAAHSPRSLLSGEGSGPPCPVCLEPLDGLVPLGPHDHRPVGRASPMLLGGPGVSLMAPAPGWVAGDSPSSYPGRPAHRSWHGSGCRTVPCTGRGQPSRGAAGGRSSARPPPAAPSGEVPPKGQPPQQRLSPPRSGYQCAAAVSRQAAHR